MKLEVFNSLWISSFGWGLTDATGSAEWRRLVDHEAADRNDKYPLRDDLYTRWTLDNFAERYNAAKSEGSANYRNIVPTVKEFRNLYFALIPEFKARGVRGKAEEHGTCTFCGGYGHVWGLVDQKGHEAEAPERVMEIPAERLPEVYYGVQAYDCPVCRAGAYRDNAYREQVRRNCLPEYIPVGDPNNPRNYPECGARVILAALKARIHGANGAPARVDDVPDTDTPKAVKSAGRLVSDDLAAMFGPM